MPYIIHKNVKVMFSGMEISVLVSNNLNCDLYVAEEMANSACDIFALNKLRYLCDTIVLH